MTDKERQIIGYLLRYRQKSFTCASDGGYANTLVSRGIWRKVKEPRLNRPKLAEVGVRDVEGALSLLSGGKPYYYHAGLTTEPGSAAGSNSSGVRQV